MNKTFFNDFHNSFSSQAYLYLGCHYHDDNTTFRVYAPHASSVSLVGDFNGWNDQVDQMKRITNEGIWEITIPRVPIFSNYKYSIKNNGRVYLKQDPYAFHNETIHGTSSKTFDMKSYQWDDEEWINKRNVYDAPINIYEVHLGSWRRYADGNYMSYRKAASELIPYVKKMGYTHIELMPLTEHPFDGSWGYQATGYFSVTSRFGTPDDFCYFVNKAHKNGIGVILDWVPAHFPKDYFGLYEYDGEYVYEDPSPTRIEHRTWGTRVFNFQKPEVKSFLISSARFFFEKYHIDGIRVDAVSSMLYLDYDRDNWEPNYYGGNHNLEAIGFLQDLNREIFKHFPNVMMIAEEATDYQGVTQPTYNNGLGFNYKWNMGWMNDTLAYIKVNPVFRRHDHHKMTFSLVYAFNENFILPISHDEVVHGKKSLVNKMPGDYEEKFAGARAYLGYMMTHPGKKLLFMGTEFAQFIEWNYKQELDWLLLAYPAHQAFQNYIRKLNHFYLRNNCLWELDRSWDGFQWLNADDVDRNIYVYKRLNKQGKYIIVVLNMSGSPVYNYQIGVDRGTYYEVLNSDAEEFGGTNLINQDQSAVKEPCLGYNYSIYLNVPKFSMIIIKKR